MIQSLLRPSSTVSRCFTASRALSVSARTMSEPKNAAGLTPKESQSLKTRSPKAHEEEVLKGIKEIYQCQAKDSSYAVYDDNAVFHDPVGIAEGIKHIREQFNGLTKLFEKATIEKFNVLENPTSVPGNKILVDQTLDYYRKGKPVKTLNSLLTLELNSNNKIIRHNEDWNHTRTSTSDDGFFEWRKKGTVSAMSPFLSQKAPE